MSAQVVIAILVGLAAMVDDLMRRHIANWIPLFALAGGVGWQVGLHGWSGLLVALEGTTAGFAAFLVFYLLGGMGGGDIKLMAGFGALLGAARLAEAALWTAGIGGLLALGVLAVRGIRRAMARWAGWPAKPAPVARAGEPPPIADSIPYAPAIALGVWLALVPKG